MVKHFWFMFLCISLWLSCSNLHRAVQTYGFKALCMEIEKYYRKNCLERKQSVSYLQLSCIKCLNLKVWASVLMLKCTWCCSPLPQTQPWYETQHPLKKSNSSTFFMLSLRCKRRLHVTWEGTMGLIKAKEVNKHAVGA